MDLVTLRHLGTNNRKNKVRGCVNWKQLLQSSFGIADHKFARHQADIVRARDALIQALQSGVCFADFVTEARNYLIQQGCSQSHIQQEIRRVKKIESYF